MASGFQARTVFGCLLVVCLQPLAVLAQIRVMSPDTLVRQFNKMGRIEGSTATFGAPFYGDRVLGSLVYGESRSSSHVPHCTAEDYDIPAPKQFSGGSTSEQTRLINIVLVRRGKCTFTTKVRVAYEKGAHAVIIVDREDSDLTSDDLKNIIVADDGFGDKIRIPSVLITKEEGNKLIEAAKQGQVIVELAWDLPTNHVVVTDLWMSSASQESLRFMRDFAPMRRKLNEVMIFQPHYAVFGMDKTSPAMYNELCYDESGQFCAEDPDGAGPITGKDVLAEDVRQLCIHSVHKVSRTSELSMKAGVGVEYSEKFWDYMEKLLETCQLEASNPQDRFGLDCSTRLMHSVGIDVPAVESCVNQNAMKFLQNERAHQAWSPRALRINGWRYSGILDPDLVTRAVCSGFIKMPDECNEILKPRDPFSSNLTIPAQAGMSFFGMLGWLTVVATIFFGALLLYKRYLKKEMRSTLREEVMLEVQAQMGEYQKMAGTA